MGRQKTIYLPAFGTFFGIVIAFFVTAHRGEGLWSELHSAFHGFLATISKTSTFTIPAGAFLGFICLLVVNPRKRHERSWVLRLSRGAIGTWLYLAPALHWFGSLYFLLSASRYGGKVESVLSALLQIILLTFSIVAGISVVHGHKWALRSLLAYLCLSVLASLLFLFRIPAGLIQFAPVGSWLPPSEVGAYVLFGVTLVFHLVLIFSAVVALGRDTKDQQERNRLAKPLPESQTANIIVRDSLFAFMSVLFLLVYFLTSQFDTQPTTPLSHILFLVLAVIFGIATLLPLRYSNMAKNLFFRFGIPLMIVESILLVARHHQDETDPIILVGIIMSLIFIGMVATGVTLTREERSLNTSSSP